MFRNDFMDILIGNSFMNILFGNPFMNNLFGNPFMNNLFENPFMNILFGNHVNILGSWMGGGGHFGPNLAYVRIFLDLKFGTRND